MSETNNKDLASLPFAYKLGNNPSDETARYYCGDCGLDLQGEDVGFVAAGETCANGEFSRCPACGEEHVVYRGFEDFED